MIGVSILQVLMKQTALGAAQRQRMSQAWKARPEASSEGSGGA